MIGDRVRAAMAERSWNSFRVTGVFEQPLLPEEADLSGALSRLVAEAGTPDIVISALPSELAAKRLLELPFNDVRRLSQAVPGELELQLPFSADDATVAFSKVGKRDNMTLVMAALVRKQDLRQHLELLAKAGLNPKTITLSLLALGAMLTRARNGAAPATHLVVEADPNSTSLVLIDAAGTPRALRTMNAGLMTPAGAPVSEAQAAPILNALRQTILAHGGELERPDVVLAGTAAPIAQVRSLLAASLSIAVRDGGEINCSSMLESAIPASGKFSACVAMLAGELLAKPVDLLNFRQNEFAFRGRARGDLTPYRTPALMAAALVAAVVLHFVLGVSSNLRRLNQLNNQIAQIAGPVLGEPSPADAKAELRAGMLKMNKRLQLIGGNVTHHSPLDTLLAVSQALPARFPVEMQDVEIDEDGMKMMGQADNYATVDQAKQALQRSDYFGKIEVSHAAAGKDPHKVDFMIEATFKDSAQGGE